MNTHASRPWRSLLMAGLISAQLITERIEAAPRDAVATASANYEWDKDGGAVWTYSFTVQGLSQDERAVLVFTLPTGWKVSAKEGLPLTTSGATPSLVSYSATVSSNRTVAFEARPDAVYGVSDSVPWRVTLGKDAIGQGELPGAMALPKPGAGLSPKAGIEWSAKDVSGQSEWTYKAKFANVTPDKDGNAELSVTLTMPEGLVVAPSSTVFSEMSGTEGGLANYKFTQTSHGAPWELVAVVRAQSRLTNTGRIAWSASVAGAGVGKGMLPGPTALTVADARNLTVVPKKEPEKTSSWWRFIFGAGAAYSFDDSLTFEVEKDTLLLRNDSEFRTTAILGAAFRTRRPALARNLKRILPNEITVAVDFAPNTTKDLDGVTFGFVWTVQPYLGVMLGARLRRGEELSDGFQRASALHVAAQQASSDPATRALYERFTLSQDKSRLASLRHFDGLPLLDSAGKPLFPGSPITDSHNTSFIIGVVVPLQFSFSPK